MSGFGDDDLRRLCVTADPLAGPRMWTAPFLQELF
jgi:hypothetical protein